MTPTLGRLLNEMNACDVPVISALRIARNMMKKGSDEELPLLKIRREAHVLTSRQALLDLTSHTHSAFFAGSPRTLVSNTGALSSTFFEISLGPRTVMHPMCHDNVPRPIRCRAQTNGRVVERILGHHRNCRKYSFGENIILQNPIN